VLRHRRATLNPSEGGNAALDRLSNKWPACDARHIGTAGYDGTVCGGMANIGGTMRWSVIWRCIRHLVVLFPVALYTGHAVGQAPTQCPNLPATHAPAFYVAAEQTQVEPTALETPIWKTITVGGWKGVNAVRDALETAPCRMAIADDADEILGRPAFPFIKAPVELDLVVLSVFELGFDDQASLHDIYARAVALGFELCPAEVGPTLRLSYLDQPPSEFLHIAMNPVAKYNGVLIDFTITNSGYGFLILGNDARPNSMLPGVERFVFVRPRVIAQNHPGLL
jgi:hypothetical protein